MDEDTKVAKRQKKIMPWIVGTWADNGSFVPNETQPEPVITDLNKMVAWTKAAYEGNPGTYSFVRKAPGQLTLAVQTVMKAVMG